MTINLTRRAVLAGAGALAAAGHSAHAADLRPLRVGYVPVIGAAALFVMDGEGWARGVGLDIKASKFDSGPAAIQAFASGTLDALAIGVAPVAVARAKGVEVSVVTAAGLGGSSFVAVPELADGFTKDPASIAVAFAKFRKTTGRRAKVATLPAGGVPTVALNYWLNRTGHVDPAEIEIVTIGIEAAQLAMLSGAVDAATLLEPSATIVLGRNPKLKAVATAREMFTDIPGVVFAVSRKMIAERRDDVGLLVDLVIRATDLIKTKPVEAAPFVAAVLGGGLVEPAIMARAMTSPAVAYLADPHAIVATTQSMLAYQAEIGDFAKAPPVDGLFDFSFYDAAAKRR
jgi:NitT/TauT family transport system substrate-binding protein